MNNIHIYEHQNSQWMQSPSHLIYHFVNFAKLWKYFHIIWELVSCNCDEVKLTWTRTFTDDCETSWNFMSLTTMRTKVESVNVCVCVSVCWDLCLVQCAIYIVSIIMVVESDKLWMCLCVCMRCIFVNV